MLSPGDPVARRCRARAHAELLQWVTAIADCTSCLKVQAAERALWAAIAGLPATTYFPPDDWELWYLRAVAYREMNSPDLALSDLTRALAQRGDGLALREALQDYRLRAARFAYDQKRFAAAMRLWAEALASEPKLGDDRQAQHRYNAARAAALSAAGQGKDQPPPDDAAKVKLRRQALDLLKAELGGWTKLLESGQPENIVGTLIQWQMDTDLAGIRDQAALAKLPAEEQKALTQLWADVAELLKTATARDGVAGKLVGPVHEIGQGRELRGQLDRQTPTLVYQLKLAAGHTYVIDMVSPDQQALDPYLVLTDATGKKLAEDDDGGGGLNVRIVFRAEQDGTFRIQATSFNAGAGAFTLTVREQANPPKDEKK